MTDDERETRIAKEQYWRTPEGLAEIAGQEAASEALLKEGDQLEADIEAATDKYEVKGVPCHLVLP